MTKATSVISTQRQDASVPHQAATTRRQFATWLAAATAGAGAAAVALPAAASSIVPVIPATAGPLSALDGTKLSEDFRGLFVALREAAAALKLAEDEFDGKYEAYRAWEIKNPQPVNGNDRRAWRRWDGKFKKFASETGYFEAQSTQVDAWRVFREAQLALAEHRPRDADELLHKACASVTFEDSKRSGPHLIALSVSFDVVAVRGLAT